MPIIQSAKKAARQTIKRTEHNRQIKKDIKLAIKAFKKTPTGQTLAKAQSELDKAVKKNLLKIRTAARRKATLVKVAKEHGVTITATIKPAQPAAEKTPKSPAKKTPTKSTKSPATKTTTQKKTPAKKPATKTTKK